MRSTFRRLLAALLLLSLSWAVLSGCSPLDTYALKTPTYPTMASYPRSEFLPGYGGRYERWSSDRERQQAYFGAGAGLRPFFQRIAVEFLSGAEGENRIYSPLNVYMVLAMLAEITEGETRREVLDLLGAPSIEALRTQAYALFNANYCDDGAEISRLASSLWMSDKITYNSDTLATLADTYYASSFRGEMGTQEYDRALRRWIDEQTGNLLSGNSSGISMPKDTVLTLATTLYFSAKWEEEFKNNNTSNEIFHAVGEDILCKMMYGQASGSYFEGESFTAVSRSLKESGDVWFILPNEDKGIADLLADGEALSFLTAPSDRENRADALIALSVPRFDISAETDLGEGLRRLGVSTCFSDQHADFSPLGVSDRSIKLESVSHGARFTVDEAGIEAAGYSIAIAIGFGGGSPDDPIRFVLDRPFLFVLTSRDGIPLFMGVVNRP